MRLEIRIEIEIKIEIWKEIYCKDLAHVNIEADKFQNLAVSKLEMQNSQKSENQEGWWCKFQSKWNYEGRRSPISQLRGKERGERENFPLPTPFCSIQSTDKLHEGTHAGEDKLLYSVYWCEC